MECANYLTYNVVQTLCTMPNRAPTSQCLTRLVARDFNMVTFLYLKLIIAFHRV